MSTTYSIACKDCKKCLWIGQQGAGSERPWLYLGDGKTNKALETFLAAHVGHPLVFDSDHAFVDYDEVECSNVPHEGPARASCAGPLDAVVGPRGQELEKP